jgi:hypothetical protein
VKQVDSLFFGNGGQLFGLFHPATGGARNHAVVIAGPLFHEYYRSHFTIKQIAVALASRGLDVLRFDYSGVGDSMGELPDDIFRAWSHNVGEALEEVRALSGATDVSLVTARFSASLGLPWHADIARHVSWDPVLDQEQFMRSLDATWSKALREHLGMSAAEEERLFESDYLGLARPRSHFSRSLLDFAAQNGLQEPGTLSDRDICIYSETNWVSAGLEMIYAHDVVRRVDEAF